MSARTRDEAEPLGTALHDADGFTRISLLSRGERVLGRLFPGPEGGGALVLVAGPDASSTCPWSASMVRACNPWAAVAAIDLPLCGARTSEKLSELAFDASHPLAARLRHEIRAQAACDLRATVTALRDAAGLSAERIGLAAAGRGADLVLSFCRESKDLDALALAPESADEAAGVVEALGPERARVFATGSDATTLASFLRERITR